MKTSTKFASVLSIVFHFSILTVGQARESMKAPIFKAGNWEINFSGSIGNLSVSESYSTTDSYYSYSHDDSYSIFYLQIGVIPAYFFTDELAFEPEINLLLQGNALAMVFTEPSISFIANLAYNFNLPEKNFVPFVRLGYGISNSLQIPAMISGLNRISEDLNINILNAGVGIKVLLAEKLIFRTEINYRSYNYSDDKTNLYYTRKEENSITSIAGIFGFSILL